MGSERKGSRGATANRCAPAPSSSSSLPPRFGLALGARSSGPERERQQEPRGRGQGRAVGGQEAAAWEPAGERRLGAPGGRGAGGAGAAGGGGSARGAVSSPCADAGPVALGEDGPSPAIARASPGWRARLSAAARRAWGAASRAAAAAEEDA